MADLLSTGLWNKQQAADYLGIAVSTLNHWICERKIVFIKMGSLVRFRKTDLDRFINKNIHGRKEPKESGMLYGVALSEPQDQG